jgi:hypothetical protein
MSHTPRQERVRSEDGGFSSPTKMPVLGAKNPEEPGFQDPILDQDPPATATFYHENLQFFYYYLGI